MTASREVIIMCAGHGTRFRAAVHKSLYTLDFTKLPMTVVEYMISQVKVYAGEAVNITVVCNEDYFEEFQSVTPKGTTLLSVAEQYVKGTAATLLGTVLKKHFSEHDKLNCVVIWGDAIAIPKSVLTSVFEENIVNGVPEIYIPLRLNEVPYVNYMLSDNLITSIDQTKLSGNFYPHGCQDFSIFLLRNIPLDYLIKFCSDASGFYREIEFDLLQFFNLLTQEHGIELKYSTFDTIASSVGFNTIEKAEKLNLELSQIFRE